MLKAFAVFDVKAASYGNPMFIANSGIALRSFSDVCAKQDSAIAQHPEDYVLYEIGTYDPNKGLLKSLDNPVIVASAASVISAFAPTGSPAHNGLKELV